MPKAANFTAPDLTGKGILNKAKHDHGWSSADADVAKKWYVRFLELRFDNPATPVQVMTEKADRLWHMHILFTDEYRNYCETVFGGYLDHTPVDPPRKPTPAEVAAATTLYKLGPMPDAITWCT